MRSGSLCARRSHEPPGNITDPGATLLTRMWCFARLTDISLVIAMSAAFAAMYGAVAKYSRPQIDDTFTKLLFADEDTAFFGCHERFVERV